VALCLSATFATAFACDPPPPIKTASGERIDGVKFEEKFPLSTDTNEVTFHGDRLRSAVELLDQAGAITLTGDYEAKGVVDKSTLVMTVRNIDRKERAVTLKNCAEPHVCAFFTDAVKKGVVEKMPVVCRDATPCVKK
jgi:hypothetical protein